MFANRLHMYIYFYLLILSPKSLKNVAHRRQALETVCSCFLLQTVRMLKLHIIIHMKNQGLSDLSCLISVSMRPSQTITLKRL